MHFIPLLVLLVVTVFLTLFVYWFTNLFRFGFARYGGCTLPLLEQCSPHTVALRGQAGMLLFAVVGVSSLIAGFSWSTIVGDPLIGGACGVGWFILFSFIDRALMASLDGISQPLSVAGERPLGKLKRLGLAWGGAAVAYLTRVLIVVLSAHINTTVVQGFIFAPEIETVIATRAVALVNPAIKKRDDANVAYGKMVTDWESYLARERNARQEWADVNKPERVAEIDRLLKEKTEEFKQIRDGGVEKRALVAAEAELLHVREQANAPVGQGDRDLILKELAEKNPLIKYLYWMIFVIEFAAFIAKILRGKDEYDAKVTEYKKWAKTTKYLPPASVDSSGDFQDTEAASSSSSQVR